VELLKNDLLHVARVRLLLFTLAALGKKISQHPCAFFGHHTAPNTRVMV